MRRLLRTPRLEICSPLTRFLSQIVHALVDAAKAGNVDTLKNILQQPEYDKKVAVLCSNSGDLQFDLRSGEAGECLVVASERGHVEAVHAILEHGFILFLVSMHSLA